MLCSGQRFSAIAALGIALAGFAAGAADQARPTLTGTVTSAEEGAMEGVLVSATKGGSTITVTVVSDKAGRYSFPEARLEPGRYALRIRAVGYELDGPGAAEIAAQKPATVDLRLRKARSEEGRVGK